MKPLNTIFLILTLSLSSLFGAIDSNETNTSTQAIYETAPSGPYAQIASKIITKALSKQPKNSYLRKIYAISNNQPIWTDTQGLNPKGMELVQKIVEDKSLDHGLKFYQLAKKLYETTPVPFDENDKKSVSSYVGMELKMSKLYNTYANYAVYGLINWEAFQVLFDRKAGLEEVYADWEIYPRDTPVAMLQKIMAGGQIEEVFNSVNPNSKLYTGLQKELERYSKISKENSWGEMGSVAGLRPYGSHHNVPTLRTRLQLMGDIQGCEPSDNPNLYDECLVEGVKHFQSRHGQNPNGIINQATAKLLSENITTLLTKLKLNLDRVRMMKNNCDAKRRIMINIPSFTLYLYEDGKIRETMRVITGTKKHPTPIFSNAVKTVVLNPYWNVPTSIIQKEMIPKLLRNKNAMAAQGIEVSMGSKKISPAQVDWAKFRNTSSVPFHFAQTPGHGNALGKIKFLFPNKFSVYMHDTPKKHLFNNDVRAFSHGCIRLHKPNKLLETFASFDKNLNLDASNKILKGKSQTFLDLANDVPIDVAYLTAWVDIDGKLQLRNDIYDYDKMQLKYKRDY